MVGKSRYHHGDLTNALVEAAVSLARTGGPDRVVLREVARRAGVSATAAYRHFAGIDDLTRAVGRCALAELENAMSGAGGDVPELCRRYVRFALAEPGLFRTALRDRPPDLSAYPPYRLLGDALGPDGGLVLWTAVHGLTLLLLGGIVPATDLDGTVDRLVDVTLRGLRVYDDLPVD
jgi:AcrR family transcriptional regulator